MLTNKEIKAMNRKDLAKLETELLDKMEAFDNDTSAEFKAIYNDYVLVSEEMNRIVEEEMDDDTKKQIEERAARIMEGIAARNNM